MVLQLLTIFAGTDLVTGNRPNSQTGSNQIKVNPAEPNLIAGRG
jgi:hypothetical protein